MYLLTVEEKMKGVSLEEEFKKNPECPVENFYAIKNWLETQDHLPKIPGIYWLCMRQESF